MRPLASGSPDFTRSGPSFGNSCDLSKFHLFLKCASYPLPHRFIEKNKRTLLKASPMTLGTGEALGRGCYQCHKGKILTPGHCLCQKNKNILQLLCSLVCSIFSERRLQTRFPYRRHPISHRPAASISLAAGWRTEAPRPTARSTCWWQKPQGVAGGGGFASTCMTLGAWDSPQKVFFFKIAKAMGQSSPQPVP